MTALSSQLPTPVIPQARPDSRQAPSGSSARISTLDSVKPNVAGDGTDPLAAAEAVAKALSGSSNLQVDSFHDKDTGRFVTRVTDRWSGRVLIQTPPDDLLRFLASAPSLDASSTLIDV